MRRHRSRLFHRIYLHGLVLLVLVTLAVGTAAAVMGPVAFKYEHSARYAALRAGQAMADPVQLAKELRQAGDDIGVRISIWTRDGELVASNIQPPLAPLSAGDLARLGEKPFFVSGRHQIIATAISGRPAYLLLSHSIHIFSISTFAVLVGAVLLALAVGSIPFARSIAAPLERLTAAARRLGSGDLGSRVGSTRCGDELGELAMAFDEMAERLERVVRSERELLANVSHELRTPLARMRVALDLAAEGDLPRARRYLAEIGADLTELERLIGDVLTASRLDLATGRGGELPLRREPVDSTELLKHTAMRFQSMRPQRTLILDLADPLPELDADPALLRRALENLLDNAHKYSDSTEPVTLSARSDSTSLVVEVRDSGIGIDPADLPRLFTPFFRTDRSRVRGTGGIGLGLALAKRIVEAHGGNMAVESSPGVGTTVKLTFHALR